MSTQYIVRRATVLPASVKPGSAPIYVDSDDNILKMIPAASGSTEVQVVDTASNQTVAGNKTFSGTTTFTGPTSITTEPTGAGSPTRVTSSMQANAQAVDHHFFIADRAYSLVSVSEVHSTAGTDAGAVTLDVKKCTGTQAPSAGATVLTATFNLKAAIDTVVNGTIVATTFTAGDRIAVDITGVTTAVAGVNVTVVLQAA